MWSLLTEPARPAVIRESRNAHWYVVATVCIGAFMGQLDASIVTIALPRIGRDLHASVGAVEWVALAYLLALVASVATVGHLADAIGRKLLYAYGFAAFTASSVLCGLAPSLPVLIAARVLQGLGAAMLQANSVALIADAIPRRLLPRAIAVQGTAQALGLALGPAVGGVLLALGGWRLIFLVNLPAGVAGLMLGWVLLPRSRSKRDIGRGDLSGALRLALAVGGPLAYLSLATRGGYANPALLAALAVGLAAVAAFVRHERSTTSPLIDLGMLRQPALSVGLVSGMLSFVVLFGALFVVPYYLAAHHTSSAAAGLELAALPVGMGIAAPIAGRVGGRTLIAGGMLMTGIGLVVIAVVLGTGPLLVGLALAGIGLGAFIPSNNASIMGAAPAGYRGLIGGLLNMTRGTGTALGVAVAAALYAAGGRNGLTVAMAALGGASLIAAAALKLHDPRE